MREMLVLIENEKNKYAKKFYELLLEEGYSIAVNSRYKNNRIHVKLNCPFKHEYIVQPRHFKETGQRCQTCRKENNQKRYANIFYKKIYKEGYQLAEGEYYTKATNKILLVCPNGHDYFATPNDFMSGNYRCSKCFGNAKMDTEEFKQKVYDLTSGEYKVIGQYISSSTHIEIRHNIKDCNHEWEVTPNNFLNHASRCPQCKSSKGEKLVESILKRNNYTFITQDKFEECRNQLPLPFDFGVYDNNELFCLIEYQERQHYEPVDFAGKGEEWALEDFKKIQHNDSIKRNFCEENDIPLIEIHYSLTEEEASDFLCKELAKYFDF